MESNYSKKYDREGKEVGLYEWDKLFEDMEYRRVGWTRLWWGGDISTVWLGLDHGFGGRRVTFETMGFGLFGRELCCLRYATTEEAERGHKAMVKYWTNPINVVKGVLRKR